MADYDLHRKERDQDDEDARIEALTAKVQAKQDEVRQLSQRLSAATLVILEISKDAGPLLLLFLAIALACECITHHGFHGCLK